MKRITFTTDMVDSRAILKALSKIPISELVIECEVVPEDEKPFDISGK